MFKNMNTYRVAYIWEGAATCFAVAGFAMLELATYKRP
ncbi:hypothetical protein P609_11060 [Comamonas thiooxydans]|nr:hypothetical protein P609_11060 [Comamonas thiooxydans]